MLYWREGDTETFTQRWRNSSTMLRSKGGSLPQDSVAVHRDTSLYTVHLPHHSTMYMYVDTESRS